MPTKSKQNQSRSRPKKAPQYDFLTPKMLEAEEIRTLLSWQAPARPFRKKDRSYYTTLAVIVILLVLILLLAKEFLLIATILSLAFVAYVLAFVPPNHIQYRISTQGITINEDFYFWHFFRCILVQGKRRTQNTDNSNQIPFSRTINAGFGRS